MQSNSNFRDEIRDTIVNVLKNMLTNADHIFVTYDVGPNTTVFKVDCHPQDFGPLLGKQGRNIEGLRRITIAMMAKHGCRAILEAPNVKKNSVPTEFS